LGRAQNPRTARSQVAGDVRLPTKSTVHAVLDRHGLVKRARMRKNRANGTPLSAGANPNDLWCTDFKGEFKLGNGRYCYPLTVSDHAARYLLLCEAFESTREATVIEAFQRLFRDRGLPVAIRRDNGLPFASPNGLYNLSRLSVWWLRLGISIERIKPGHPQQNGRHERMHLTLKKEATRPPGLNSLQQQARFDAFVRELNAERPHEALAMRCPAELYTGSPRPYDGLPELQYPWHDRDILVTACGRICMHKKKDQCLDRARRSETRHQGSRRRLGSSASCTMISAISTSSRGPWTIDNPFGTRLSPMS
jgi:transposase InsO family protein